MVSFLEYTTLTFSLPLGVHSSQGLTFSRVTLKYPISSEAMTSNYVAIHDHIQAVA